MLSTLLASVLEDSKLEPIDFDLERAKHCAENFGSCSVEEMEMLRDSKLSYSFFILPLRKKVYLVLLRYCGLLTAFLSPSERSAP
jgi:hypothetical protein